jgi:predicted component of type VI protein secretion system
MSTTAYDFMEGLIYVFGDEEARALKRLSKKLDILRYYVRLSMDLKILSTDQYGHAAERMDEIGRLLGG